LSILVLMTTKEVLKTGIFKSASGKTVTITDQTLENLVKNFNSDESLNSEGYKVPLFLGHPDDESKAPAHGWIKSLSKNGSSLFAEFYKLTENALEAIKNFSFRDVSVSIYKDVLLHIGLTNTPAVPGLGDFQLAHKDESITLTYFEPIGDNMAEDNVKLALEKKDLEVKLAKFQADLEAAQAVTAELTASKATLETEKAELAASFKQINEDFSKLQKSVNDKAKADELKADSDFIDSLCKAGKLRPADKEVTLSRLTKFSKEEIEPGKTAKDLYKESLEARTTEIEEGEKFANGETQKKESKLTQLTKEYMTGKKVDFVTASKLVLADHPELNIEEK